MKQKRNHRLPISHLWRRRASPLEATIAVWGAAQTGKTALLAALESAAKHEGVSIYSLDAQTEEVMKELRKRRSEHLFPTSTRMLPEQKPALLRFGIKSKKSGAGVTVNLVDAPGRWWIESGNGAHKSSQGPNAYELFLNQCDGIICLLDPTQALKRAHTPELWADAEREIATGTELQTMLAQLRCTRLSGSGLLNTKIAICLTQMDRAEHYGHLGREEAYFQRLYGALPIHNWVQRRRWRFFGTSAVGVLQRAGYVVSNTYQDHQGQELILDPFAPPINVLQPIKWILGLG